MTTGLVVFILHQETVEEDNSEVKTVKSTSNIGFVLLILHKDYLYITLKGTHC